MPTEFTGLNTDEKINWSTKELMNEKSINDNKTGIFCSHGPKHWQINSTGLLSNKRIAVKDVFSIKGEKNSAGNPDYFKTAAIATKTASAVDKLMHAGTCFIGFTHTDELAYSLEGNNMHYGAADNPNAPGHACGGSSMGSAAAVAAGLADIGLGTDTGGSIRVPASYCGLYGIRPSHNIIQTDGLIPLASPFDTIGWLTTSPELLNRTAEILLPPQAINPVDTLVSCDALFNLVKPDFSRQLKTQLQKVTPLFSDHRKFKLKNTDILFQLADAFRVLQGRAIAKQYGNWLKTQQPTFSPAITQRFAMAMALTEQEELSAQKVQQDWQVIISDNLSKNSCLFLPTTPTSAPKLAEDTTDLRMKIITLSAIAGLSRSVQIHLPTQSTSLPHPYGFSLMMAHGNDKSLLEKVIQLTTRDTL